MFQIWIYGNSFESSLVAVVNPNKDALEHWAADCGVSGDLAALCENPEARKYILGELTKIAKEKKVSVKRLCFCLSFFSLRYKLIINGNIDCQLMVLK